MEQTLGMVPEYEAREAAVYVHCPWHVWIKLTGADRAYAVAHYRTHLAIGAHVQQAAEDHAESESARARSRARG